MPIGHASGPSLKQIEDMLDRKLDQLGVDGLTNRADELVAVIKDLTIAADRLRKAVENLKS